MPGVREVERSWVCYLCQGKLWPWGPGARCYRFAETKQRAQWDPELPAGRLENWRNAHCHLKWAVLVLLWFLRDHLKDCQKAWPLFSHFPRQNLMTQFAAGIWSIAGKDLLAFATFFFGVSFIETLSWNTVDTHGGFTSIDLTLSAWNFTVAFHRLIALPGMLTPNPQ